MESNNTKRGRGRPKNVEAQRLAEEGGEVELAPEQLEGLEISHRTLQRLKRDPAKPKQPRTPAQQASLAKAIEARKAKSAEKREAQLKAAEEAARKSADDMEAAAASKRRITVKIKPVGRKRSETAPPQRPAPLVESSESSSEEERPFQARAKPKPAPKVRRAASDADDDTCLDTDVPSELDIKAKKVIVPRKVKEAVRKVKAVKEAIANIQSVRGGFSIFGS
jgi:hypothetical protein